MWLRRAILLTAVLAAPFPAPAAERPVRVAFVDTGNTGRSVTSEALAMAAIARDGLNAQVISRAVNLNPYNIRPEENFVTLLAQRGIDIRASRATQFGPQDAAFSDLILTMTEAHKAWVAERYPAAKDKVRTLSEYVTGSHTDVLDAFGKPMEFYRTVLAQLDPLVAAAVAQAVAKRE